MSTPSLPAPARQCIDCGRATNNTLQRCDTCKPIHTAKHNKDREYYHTQEWRQLRHECLTRDYWQCTICSGDEVMTAHHVTPRKAGGLDILDNLVTLCHTCHGLVESDDRRSVDEMHEAIRARRRAGL